MNDRTSYLTPFVCFLVGGVVGAAAVMLCAPQSGRATRETIARKFGETTGAARELKNRTAHRVSEAVSALSGDGHELGGKPGKSDSV
jgi:gas vesicle protein